MGFPEIIGSSTGSIIGRGSDGDGLIEGLDGATDVLFVPKLRDNIISVAGTTTSNIKDASITTSTSSTVDHEFDIVVSIPLTWPQDYTLTNLTPSIISISGNTVTRISDGFAHIKLDCYLGSYQIFQIVSRNTLFTTHVFNNYVSGTLARALTDTVDNLISGKTPQLYTPTPQPGSGVILGTSQSLFQRWSVPLEHNAALFTNPIDVSFIAGVYNNGSYFGGALVSPQHFLTAAHNLLNGNGSAGLTFADSGSSSYNVAVQPANFKIIPNTDIAVVKLQNPINAAIEFAKVFPSNFRNYLPQINYGIPVFFTNQFKTLQIGEWDNANAAAISGIEIRKPVKTSRQPWYLMPVQNDSSGPIFAMLGTTPILISSWNGPTNGGDFPDNVDAINAAMTALGGGYQLTTVDLSSYPTF